MLVARTVLGLLVGALIMRRIVDPPDLSAAVHPQLGMWLAFLGALMVAIGGLVDTGRRVVAAYPGLAGGGRAPRSLPPGDGPGGGRGAVLRVPNEAERTR